MPVIPQDRRGQILLVLTVGALAVGYFAYSGFSLVGVDGIKPLGMHRDSLQVELDSLTAQVARAKRDLARGGLSEMQKRLDDFAALNQQMRLLVPTRAEVPNLLDDITSRAKMRGTTFAGFQPQATESGSPFDTQRYRLTVAGQYDQIAEFLADIASLPRIIVPYDVHFQHVQGPAADTSKSGSLLQATLAIRTYVKPVVTDTTPRPAPAGAAARKGAGDD